MAQHIIFQMPLKQFILLPLNEKTEQFPFINKNILASVENYLGYKKRYESAPFQN